MTYTTLSIRKEHKQLFSMALDELESERDGNLTHSDAIALLAHCYLTHNTDKEMRYVGRYGQPTNYHVTPVCPLLNENGVLAPTKEPPGDANPCSGCAGGLTAGDIREMVGESDGDEKRTIAESITPDQSDSRKQGARTIAESLAGDTDD